jgi:hypothetical protein
MTLRKREDAERKDEEPHRTIALYGELALEEAVDLTMNGCFCVVQIA